MIGPVYAQELGLPDTAIATFMGAGILGGAVLQYPFGILSDRYDRRIILLIATAGAARDPRPGRTDRRYDTGRARAFGGQCGGGQYGARKGL